MAKRSIQGLRAIVTGCSSGIGKELARQLYLKGASVVITARRAEKLSELITDCRAQSRSNDATPADSPADDAPRVMGDPAMHAVAGDLSDPALRERLVSEAIETFGGIDLLINNAGVGSFGPFFQSTENNLRQVMEVNLFAVSELTRLAYPQLVAGRHPMVVNMGSVLGHFSVPLKSEYCASKFALRGLTDCWRLEFARHGIDVLLVSPSTTDTEFFDSALDDATQIDWKRYGAMPPAEVAARTIRAIESGRKEIVLSRGGRFLTWANRIWPSWVRRMVARDAQRIQAFDARNDA